MRTRQADIHDSGLLPESEIARLAEANGKTIYEIVRDLKLYDLSALLDAAGLAPEENTYHKVPVRKLTQAHDLGLGY